MDIDWVLFTPEQVVAVLAMNDDTDMNIVPRVIDNPDHPEYGNSVATTRVADAPPYDVVWQEYLKDHTRISGDPEDMFLPDDPLQRSTAR